MNMFGLRLKSLRKNKNISQKELAKIVGVAESTIGMYERDVRKPDFELLKKFADFFDVSTDYLLGRTEQKTINERKNEEQEFEEWLNNPDLNVFYRELPKSDDEKIRQLREIWEIIKKQ